MAHQNLLGLARREKIAVPELEEEDQEASQVDTKDTIVWSDYIMLGVKDWDDSLPLGEAPHTPPSFLDDGHKSAIEIFLLVESIESYCN